MPPNVKETAAVIDSLATLNINDLVHSKFLPLTQECAEEAPREDTTPALSSKEKMIADILQHEANRQMFTANHIESNLVQQAKKIEADVPTDASNDDYWNMPAPTEQDVMTETAEEPDTAKEEQQNDHSAKVNGEVYCVWHIEHEEQKRQDLIASIMQDEKLRETFSVNSIEASLIADAKRRGNTVSCSENVVSKPAESDSY